MTAAAHAEAAARLAGVEICELTAADELRDASALFAAIWQPTDVMPFEMIRVVQHIGGYVAGAYDDGAMIGAAVGFPTANGSLHSHLLGVTPKAQGRRIGFAIKLHQRAWALDRNISAINWTFDPLARRNAYFNLVKLAVHAPTYLEDFYGAMHDQLNIGDPSDRLLAVWHLDDPAVVKAAAGTSFRPIEPDPAAALVLTEDPDGAPQVDPCGPAAQLAIGTPADIAALRAHRPDLARAWRRAQRETFRRNLDAGYRISGFTRTGFYLLDAF